MKGEAQQAALLEVLLERQHACPQIEERLRRQPVVRAEHAYDAILLNDEFSPAAVGGLLEMERGRQTFGNRLQGQILCRHGRGAHQHREQDHMDERFFLPMKRSHACGDVHRILSAVARSRLRLVTKPAVMTRTPCAG